MVSKVINFWDNTCGYAYKIALKDGKNFVVIVIGN